MKTLDEQLKESGYMVMFWDKTGIDQVAMDKASEFTVIRLEPWNMFRGPMPKRKPFDIDYVLEFVSKKEKIEYINYKAIFDKLQLPNVGVYNTSYGVGVEVMFSTRKETIEKIEAFLNEHNIVFTNEYSEAMWVYRFKFSKSKENIDRIIALTKS